jgi:hypothetical protein
MPYFEGVTTDGSLFYDDSVGGRGRVQSKGFVVECSEEGARGEEVLYLL